MIKYIELLNRIKINISEHFFSNNYIESESSAVIFIEEILISSIIFKLNEERKIFMLSHLHNKSYSYVFNKSLEEVINYSNNFYKVLNNSEEFLKTDFNDVKTKLTKKITDYFTNKSCNNLNFMFGPKKFGKTSLIKDIIIDLNNNSNSNNNIRSTNNKIENTSINNITEFYLDLKPFHMETFSEYKICLSYIKSFFYKCKSLNSNSKYIVVLDGIDIFNIEQDQTTNNNSVINLKSSIINKITNLINYLVNHTSKKYYVVLILNGSNKGYIPESIAKLSK